MNNHEYVKLLLRYNCYYDDVIYCIANTISLRERVKENNFSAHCSREEKAVLFWHNCSFEILYNYAYANENKLQDVLVFNCCFIVESNQNKCLSMVK